MKVDNITDQSVRTLFVTATVILGLYVIAHLFGPSIFPQVWSLLYGQVLPLWYTIAWIFVTALLVYLFINLSSLDRYLRLRFAVPIAVVAILALMFLFRYDSFFYGGGNLRVAQLSQVERIIPRWFEWGTTTIVSALFTFVKQFEPRPNWASMHAWQIYSFLCTALTLIASVLATRLLAKTAALRLLLFLILFFGSQTVAYFGFIGAEPAVVAFFAWAFYFSVRMTERRSVVDLIWLWAICLFGIVVHFSLLILVPAAVYFTIANITKNRKSSPVAYALAALLYLGLVALYYWQVARSLEFSRMALHLSGKPPMTDYGLFSILHITDWLQLLLLASPMVIVAVMMLFNLNPIKQGNSLLTGWSIAALSGLTFSFIADPENSMALDLPRLAVYLTPLACVTALLAARLNFEQVLHRRLLAVLAASAIAVPAIFVPSLVRTEMADKFATAFLPNREIYWRTTCLSFRDVYWTFREMDKADRWEALLPVKSIDYMNIRGCSYLVANGDNEEALKRLYQSIARLPYWTEPRVIIAQLLIKLRYFKEAKAQIDTCLMLEPNDRTHLMSLYSYYRDLPDYPNAIKTIQYLLYLNPTDPDIKIDQMIVMLRAGFPQVADSIANYLLAEDSTRAYPYMIKGMIAERQSDTATAIRNYNTFLRVGPLQPDTSIVRSRLRALSPPSGQ